MSGMRKYRVSIKYCQQCNYLPRAAWLAQELLTTFAGEIEALALVPAAGGVLEIWVDDKLLLNRQQLSDWLAPKEIKQRVRDRIAPDKTLGHSDRKEKKI